jgi:hypothetical protein
MVSDDQSKLKMRLASAMPRLDIGKRLSALLARLDGIARQRRIQLVELLFGERHVIS